VWSGENTLAFRPGLLLGLVAYNAAAFCLNRRFTPLNGFFKDLTCMALGFNLGPEEAMVFLQRQRR
jgi:hypothetical protein